MTSVEQQTEMRLPINMGISKLKRELRALYPGMPKSNFNRIVRGYKKRGWSEYAGVVRHRGHFPAHPSYKTGSVEVTSLDSQGENISVRNITEDEEITTIEVKHGNKK